MVLKSTLHKNSAYDFTKLQLGNGSIFAPVDIWHRRRKILVPSFAPKYVNKFIAVFEAQDKTLVEQLKSKVGKGNFSCWDFIASYALDSVCETVFGMNVEMQRQPEHPLFNAFNEFLKSFVPRIFKPWVYSDAIYKLTATYSRQEQMKEIIYEFINDLIYKKKAQIRERNGNEAGTNNDPIHTNQLKSSVEFLINASFTHEELREEALVLLLAGTDTSAAGISTTILLLSQHTDIQERVYREIQEVIGDLNNPLQLKDLLKLKYTKAVINETLRLYPPVPFIVRDCIEDIILPSGITLPKDTIAVINIWGIHHNPQHWGEDVNDFNPDRFMSGQIPKAFMPFSHGLRNCIGQQYAMLSLTTTLVTLLRNYRFTPATNLTYDKNNPLRISFDVTLKHVDNYTIQIENRDKM
ncbi:cytochrome P450 4c3-like [Nymphalis io]|uniref:cytochrome P450 4c3-like n=1 Tax=Inachis io TaxID=171585 RepID=UPI0021677F16|nr:cytochrome P450 4c3-like [Nymphalis io]